MITRTELEDTTTTAAYAEFGDYMLKYGGDGVTLLNAQGEEVWNAPQTMENPVVAMRGEYCVIYDKKGTDIGVYNIDGKVVDIQTKLPVEKGLRQSAGNHRCDSCGRGDDMDPCL
ncbi:MAG: DUF5711 family protein [Blautia faecicola]